MARRSQLGSILDMLRAEVGHSLSRAVGINDERSLRHMLNRVQDRLYYGYDWPFARVYTDEPLRKGERYYTYQRDIDPDRVQEVWTTYGASWVPVRYGITPMEYGMQIGETTPVQKWQPYLEKDLEEPQYEVWPVAADDNQLLRMYGLRQLPVMINDKDRAVLDDTLLVLFTAAEILARQGTEDAQLMLRQAESHMIRLRANVGSQPRQPFVMGGGEPVMPLRPGIDFANPQ